MKPKVCFALVYAVGYRHFVFHAVFPQLGKDRGRKRIPSRAGADCPAYALLQRRYCLPCSHPISQEMSAIV